MRVPRALCIFLAAIYGWADSTGLGSSKTLHEDWRAAMNRPVQLEEKGDLVQAERVILASILEAERRPNSDPEWLPVALTRLGGLNRLMGRDGPAEALYQQSADLWRTRFGESSLGLSLALSDLAWVYVARGQPRRAAPLWQHSLQIRIAKLGPVHPSVARIYGYMAVGAFADHRLADAELYCRHSLDIYAHTSEIAGENRPRPGFAFLDTFGTGRHKRGNAPGATSNLNPAQSRATLITAAVGVFVQFGSCRKRSWANA